MSKNKKRSSKNLKINTRIIITSVLGIVIPLLIIIMFSSAFIGTIASFFSFSSVTSNTYSTVNQIQWNQTISNISDELTGDDSDSKKAKRIKEYVAPLEQYASSVYIEKNNKQFYATESAEKVYNEAQSITKIDKDKNLFHYSHDGMVIINHMQNGDDDYLVMITNKNYNVENADERLSPQNLSDILLGRTGIIMLLVVIIFVVSIVIISFITAHTILFPIKKIQQGADEIARGNLDCEIDYKSTNELGQMVESFNAMRLRLKESVADAQKSEQMRIEMTAGIAHDLRTPLTSIKGYVEGLMDGIADTPERRDMYLKTIYDSTCQTEKLLDSLLTVSKFELGSNEVNMECINVNEYLADAAIEMGQFLKEHNFDFIMTNNCSADAYVKIDGDSFARVFSNIIGNSVKYASKNKQGIIRLFASEYEKCIILEFEDNGIGVDKDALPKIFDTMYRTDPARSKTADGSGLGLAVCKQIVEQNKGSIWARNHYDGGLSVFISLPKKRDNNEKSFDN